MNRHPETIAADLSISEADRRMRASAVGEFVVVDDAGVCGIVTNLDLARALASDEDGITAVGQVGRGGLAMVGPDTLIEHAVQLMREQELRRVPVLIGDRLVGVVGIEGLDREP